MRGPDQQPRKRRAISPTPPPPGPGRPRGSTNALPLGAVGAIKALRYRVPDGTPEPLAEVADRAFSTVVQVMNGEVPFGGSVRLRAARYVREEVCGQIPQRHEANVTRGLAERIERARLRVSALARERREPPSLSEESASDLGEQ